MYSSYNIIGTQIRQKCQRKTRAITRETFAHEFSQNGLQVPQEGVGALPWALRAEIVPSGQISHSEMVTREMQRARSTDDVRYFQGEFLKVSRVTLFFSPQSTTLLQNDPDEMDI